MKGLKYVELSEGLFSRVFHWIRNRIKAVSDPTDIHGHNRIMWELMLLDFFEVEPATDDYSDEYEDRVKRN